LVSLLIAWAWLLLLHQWARLRVINIISLMLSAAAACRSAAERSIICLTPNAAEKQEAKLSLGHEPTVGLMPI